MRKSVPGIILLALGLSVVMALSPPADFVTLLQSRLKAYYEKRGGTKIHLTFNQPEYVGGDTAFFNALVVQEQNLIPVAGKLILNVKLTNSLEKVLIHTRIICKAGNGAGQLILPQNLLPGNYLLSAYADGITDPKDPSLYFQTELLISGEKEFVRKESSLACFAEGGNLVEGIRTKIVVTAGKGNSLRVVDASGNEVISSMTGPSGIAGFFLTPGPGEHYFIETSDGRKKALDAKPDGIVLHAENNTAEKSINVEFQAPKTSLWRHEEIILVMTSRGTVCFSKVFTLGEDPVKRISIPVDCNAGIAQLTLFTSKGIVLAERLLFIEPKPLELSITPDAQGYQVRRPVKVEISLKDSGGQPASANFSLSVYKEDLFSNSVHMPELEENIYEQSDLAAYPLFSRPGKVTHEELDDFLITQHWGRFQWDDVFLGNTKAARTSRDPFYFKGKIRFSKSENEVPDSTLIIFYLNYYDFVYGIYAKSKGEVEFPLFLDFRNDEIFYSLHYKKKEIMDAVFAVQEDPGLPGFSSTVITGSGANAYAAFSKLKGPVVKSFAYYLGKQDSASVAEDQRESDLEEVDLDISIEKFKNFNSMTEVLTEVVPFVRPHRVNNQDGVQVFLKEVAMFATHDPLYFIDGVLMDSTAYFLALDPNNVSRIKVIRSEKLLSRFDEMGKNGIVIVETKTPERAAAIPRSKRTLEVTGISLPVPFMSPDHSTNATSRVPDLRTTLFWRPQLLTDKNGKASVVFYAGDATGSFRLRVEGITPAGQPFSGIARFTVTVKAP